MAGHALGQADERRWNHCVVDGEIEPPISLDGCAHHRLNILGLRHIRSHESGFAARLLDEADGLFCASGIDVGNYDFAAFACDQLAASLSESATGSGHQTNLSVQISHGSDGYKFLPAASLGSNCRSLRRP
jgi:hypothetical protein